MFFIVIFLILIQRSLPARQAFIMFMCLFVYLIISCDATCGPEAARSYPRKAPLEFDDQSQRFSVFTISLSLRSNWRTPSPQSLDSQARLSSCFRQKHGTAHGGCCAWKENVANRLSAGLLTHHAALHQGPASSFVCESDRGMPETQK